MDHHRQHHHQPPRHNNHPPRQHQQHHHPPHIITSPSSSRYLPPHPPPPHPPPPPPQPPPPQLNMYPPHHHHHHHHHPNLSPPFRPDFPFINSPPHHPHPRDDHLPHHRDMVFRSHPFDDIPNHNHSHIFVDDVDRHRFRLNELPPQPPPLPPPPPPPPQHPRVSPVARRSPNQFAQFDRFGRQFDTSPPPPPPSRFREDMSLDPRVRLQQHNDSIEYHHQLRRERVEDDRRVLGVVDRLEGGFEHDWNRSIDHDRGRERERDHHEKYYPEMVSRNEFEPNSGNSEYMNDEVLMRERGGANVGRFEENVNKRYGGGREVSRSPIKFRIGGVVADDRFSNRGRKEDVQEYNTSVNNRNAPKKILQKKSAFLRIQQPGKPQHHSSSNFRNRFDNSASPGPHKGKESTSEFVDTRIGEERVGSPVELDVSFKSNALVAKAIMAAPPSTSGVGVNMHKGVSSDSFKVVSESQAKLGSQLKVESQAKVASLKKKSVAVLKKDDKNSKIGVKVSPIMKRVGKSNNVEVHSSESPPSGSSSLSGGITRKVAPKGKVVGKVDKNAGTDKLSSLNIRKKRKASGLLSRLSNPMPTSTNADCGLVNVDSTAGRPSEGSMPFDISVKKSEEELSCGSKVIGSTQNKIVDMGQVDINETPTVMDQQEVVGELLPESSAPKRILESFPDSSGSLSSGVTEGCGNPKGFGQVEQRFTITDEDETKFVEKCNSDIHLDTESVKVQDMAAMLASNGSVEGTSELASVCMVENVENNAVCSGNLNTLNSVPLMSFISNSFKNEVDLMCPKVDADEPCETQVLSSPDNATIGLSLGGLYADRNDEPRLRYSEDISRLVSFSNEVNKHCKSQAFSSPENATVGLSLGGLYSDRKFESDIGHSEDNAKLESFSKDISSDKRTLLSYDDDVTISLTNLNTTDIRITNDTQEQQTQGSDVLVNDETMLGKEEAPDTYIGAGGVLPSVKKGNILFNRKRKVGTEQDSLGSRIPESCHESRVSLSFPIENAMFPLEECCSAISGPPCDEPNVSKRIDYTGSCIEGMDSINPIGDLDKIDNFISHGKKRKILPEYSVVSDAPGSKTSDLPPAEPTLLPQAGGSVANVFPQLTEGVELQKSEITGEDTTGAASGSLCAETCSFVHNSNSDSLCNDSCLLVTECAPPNADKPSSPESRCNQKISANFMTGKGDDENGFIVLESSCRITADVNSDLLCLSNDHTENVNQGHLAINMESNDNGTVTNDGNSGLSRFSADHTEKVDQVPLAINTESDDNGMATNNGNSGLSCFSVDLSGNETQGPLVMSVEYDDSRMTTKDGNSGFPCLLAAQNGDDYQGSSAVNMECNDNITLNAESTYDGVTTNSDILDKRPDVDFPEDCSYLPPTLDISNASPDLHVISGEKVSIGDQKSNQSSAIQTSFCPQPNLLPENHINSSKPGNSASSVQPFSRISVPLPSKNVKTTMASSSSYRKLRRNVLTRSEATPSTSQRSPPINPSNKTNTYPGKPRTWNRTNSLAASNIPVKKPPVAAPPHRPPYGKAMKVQDTSYIRKGNSLVRNPVSAISSAGSLALGASTSGSRALGASIDRSKLYDTYRTKKVVGSVTESTELPDGFVAGGQRAPIEMSKTPPLSCSGKTSDNDGVCLGECTSSLNVDQTEGTDKEEAIKSSESNSLRDSESVLNRDLEDTGIFSDGVLGSSSKKMVYIKRKSNQLIAASKSSQFSVHDMGKTAASSSDINYYKRRKNQLIRASSDGNIQQMVAVIKDTSKSLSQRAPNVYGRNSTKKPSNKGKSQKLSLVWKLGDSKASGKGVDALKSRRLLSHLLPWKRATYLSRKPLSSRKRGAVYVRSGRGFSLRRSKVTSLPGTSLKWSKSMEKRSKKVEEEAALAVAELDSVQKSGSSGVCSKAASNIHSVHNAVHSLKLHPGERIFRIGVYRYRMDPSRKTLHRISDEEISDFTASKSEKDARKTYVPKRLLIGSDEYVRIGNGNQLVRDPKKRTRILASEKVRWSLHTARMRLAKKRKFCQFFTRFGKCNKGEGKCPYIHDPSKVAVCTKFLNGLCADPNCKLTHKVIPERMPDCSFYLQGLCSNEKCPYRHVNVNPKASICENFLRGYCAEGNECRKKHSYICPDFEACGSCPQGSKCKLYHPKKCKAKKRKISRDHNNAKGRYFGSDLSLVVEPEKHIEPSEGNMCIEEDFGDFISLDVVDDDDEAHENSGLTSEQSFLCEDDPLNSEFNDLDELIKPLSIIGTL